MMTRLRRLVGMPLLSKELHELAARRRTWTLRVAFAAGLLAVFLIYYLSYIVEPGSGWSGFGFGDSRALSSSVLGGGAGLFDAVIAVEVYAILLFLPGMLAGTIAKERESGTLELLELTGLGPSALLAQKLVGRLVPMLTLLLTGLPLLAVAYSLGGISARDVWLSVGSLTLLCLQVGAFALLISTVSATTASAFATIYILGATIVLLLPTALVPMIWWAGYGAMFRDYGYAPPLARGTVVSLAFSGAYLLAARVAFSRLGASRRQGILRGVLRRLDAMFHVVNRYLGGVTILRGGCGLPGERPIHWRETSKRLTAQPHFLLRLLLWIELPLMLLAIAVVATGTVHPRHGGDQVGFLSGIVFLLWGLAAFLLLSTSVGLIQSERSKGTLDVLLTTPLSSRDIIDEKFLALRRLRLTLACPLLTVVFVEAWAEATARKPVWESFAYVLTSIVAVPIYFRLFSWVGLWIGLALRSWPRALASISVVVLLVAVLPFLTGLAGGYRYRHVWWISLVRPPEGAAFEDIVARCAVFTLAPGMLFHRIEYDDTTAYIEVFAVLLAVGLAASGLAAWCRRRADRLLGRP